MKASQTPERPADGPRLCLVALAFHLFLCPICFLPSSISNTLISRFHLSSSFWRMQPVTVVCCLCSGSVALGPVLQCSPGSQWHSRELRYPNPLLRVSLPFPPLPLLRSLAFEEFGLGLGAQADGSVVLRENLKGFLSVGILYNKDLF